VTEPGPPADDQPTRRVVELHLRRQRAGTAEPEDQQGSDRDEGAGEQVDRCVVYEIPEDVTPSGVRDAQVNDEHGTDPRPPIGQPLKWLVHAGRVGSKVLRANNQGFAYSVQR